jgi:lipoprotein-anchoring transpeptidase ErfK/SrfK
MPDMNRRAVLLDAAALGAAFLVGGCVSSQRPARSPTSAPPYAAPPPGAGLGPESGYYAAIYGPVEGERFPIPAVDLSQIDPAFLRSEVDYATDQAPGTIVVDPQGRYLYFVEPGGRTMRYGVGVGREGFAWSGAATINSKQEWPDWYPPKEMFDRQPELLAKMSQLQSGLGVPGGPGNPLGARALYLWQNGKDTLYRIHGTFEPWTIGKNVSSGCIRMINQDVIDLYARTAVGAEVVVLPARVG